jgi:tetratricopeptide (TPR) repeat protein
VSKLAAARSFLPALALLMLISVSGADAESQAAAKSPYRPTDPLNNSAFDHFYNLEFDRSVEEFRRIADRYPDDPFSVNHLLTAELFRELYRMGALNSADYSSNNFITAPRRTADPKAKEEIKYLINRALWLEQKQLQANPKDVDALYARGVTRGQFAICTALIDHAWISALRNAVGARRDHEKVLELSPNYVDAKLVVGAHNYVVGSLPWGVKVASSLLGISGNKAKGLEYLREAADGGSEASIDAKVVLVVFLRREHRFPEALSFASNLVASFPHSSLLKMEEANILRDQGKNQDAAGIYREIWQGGRAGHYPGQRYQAAAVALGDVLRSDKNYAGAAAAYELVNQDRDASPELQQKATLAAGEMYDLLRNRDLAVKKYEQVIALKADNAPADSARKFLKSAYRE